MIEFSKTSFTEDDGDARLVVNGTGGLIVSYMKGNLGSNLTPLNWMWTGQLFINNPDVTLTFSLKN